MVIYVIINKINGKCYVGQTTRTLEQRIAEHKSSKDTCIGKAIQKYGRENFEVKVLEECNSIEELNEREIFWIAEYNSVAPNGYNLTEGGKNCIFSQAARLKISIAITGLKRSANTCRKIAEVKTGTHLSKKTRDKMSAVRKGKPKSAATRAKMKLAQEKNRKKVLCTDTGEIFDSISAAALFYNISSGGISSTCRGLRKTAGKLYWKFIED